MPKTATTSENSQNLTCASSNLSVMSDDGKIYGESKLISQITQGK